MSQFFLEVLVLLWRVVCLDEYIIEDPALRVRNGEFQHDAQGSSTDYLLVLLVVHHHDLVEFREVRKYVIEVLHELIVGRT